MPTQTISRCGGGDANASYSQLIRAIGPDGFWKLNETAGVVANDSSGNGYTGTLPFGWSAPTWATTHLPPGELAPTFTRTPAVGNFTNASFPQRTGDFSAFGWIRHADVTSEVDLIYQGDAIAAGWAVQVLPDNAFPGPKKVLLAVSDGVHRQGVYSDSEILVDTDYFIGFVRRSGTFTIYINAVAQSSTYSGTYVGTTGIGFTVLNGNASYVFCFARALDQTQIDTIYSSAPG